MKTLSTIGAGDLNFYAQWVKFEDRDEQKFLHLFFSYEHVQALKLSQISTPNSLLAFTVFNCLSLHTIEMSDNRILKGRKKLNDDSLVQDITILCKAFKKLPNLTSLDLSNNELGEHTPLLIPSISSSLKALNLSKNEIGENGNITTNTLTILINLTHLDLSDNNLNKPTLKILQTYPQAFRMLKSLDIRKNFDPETLEFSKTIRAFENHNQAVNEPLFKSFCRFLITHPEVDPSATSEMIGEHHDHTITLYHD